MGVVEKWAECSSCWGEGMVKVGSMSEATCQACDGEGGWMVLDDEGPANPCGLCGVQESRPGLTACRGCAG